MAYQEEEVIIFIYTGGEVPEEVTHVLIDKSVKVIPARAFFGRRRLETVECHDGVEKIGRNSFTHCHSLRWIKIPGVIDIEILAFANCVNLEHVEFGDKLETIKEDAFRWCASLRSITLPSIKCIRSHAFMKCTRLADVELSKSLDTIGRYAFAECPALRRIAIPLKDGIIVGNSEFGWCNNLTTVNLVGGVHKSISSLHMESWRNEMNTEIDRINQVLPTTSSYANDKTGAIQKWIRSVLQRMDRYKTEHCDLLTEATIPIVLALWKIKLKDTTVSEGDEHQRSECRISCGSNIIIHNVLAFLTLPDYN
jgi:hypothetical protein